jgi:hypothetical protein
MNRTTRTALTAMAISLVLGACSGSPNGGAATTPPVISSVTATAVVEATPSAATTPEPTASEIAGGGPEATAATVDPCSLLTAAEASTLKGKPLGAGVSTVADQDRVCTWKNGLSEVKLILAPPSDPATANAYWDAERATFPPHVAITDLKLFDRSAYGSGDAAGVSVSAMFVIDGGWFFDLYCGFPSCSQNASIGGAQLIAGRLP